LESTPSSDDKEMVVELDSDNDTLTEFSNELTFQDAQFRCLTPDLECSPASDAKSPASDHPDRAVENAPDAHACN